MKKILSIIAVLLLIVLVFVSCKAPNGTESVVENTESIFRQSLSTVYARQELSTTSGYSLTPFQASVSTNSHETIASIDVFNKTDEDDISDKITESTKNNSGVNDVF